MQNTWLAISFGLARSLRCLQWPKLEYQLIHQSAEATLHPERDPGQAFKPPKLPHYGMCGVRKERKTRDRDPFVYEVRWWTQIQKGFPCISILDPVMAMSEEHMPEDIQGSPSKGTMATVCGPARTGSPSEIARANFVRTSFKLPSSRSTRFTDWSTLLWISSPCTHNAGAVLAEEFSGRRTP